MTDHDEIRDLLAAVALGAGTPDDERLVDAHAATCAACRAELEEMRAATASLALSVPQLEPPPGLRRSIMDVVEREARTAPANRRVPRSGLGERLSRVLPAHAGLWPVLAAGLAAVAVAAVVWGAAFRAPQGPNAVTVAAVATQPGVSGNAEVQGGRAVLRLAGLPRVPVGRAYEVWIIREGQAPRSAGFMGQGPDGALVALATGLEGAQALAVTPEDLGNTAAPTSRPLVTVDLGGA